MNGISDAPDVGTIGGTMSDDFGESSVTLGGEISPAQAAANAEAMGFGGSDFGDFAGLPSLLELTPANVNSWGPVANVAASMPGEESVIDNILNIIGKNKGLTSVLGLAIPGLAPVLGMAQMAAATQTPQGVPSAIGGMMGSTLGSTLGLGPIGALAGGLAGSAALGSMGISPGGVDSTEEGGTMNLGGTLAGLGGMYQANEAARQSGELSRTLGGLYGQDSPYAQALREQLARKDAAAGRRSQYGPREVELQAKLANMYAQTAPQTIAAQKAERLASNQRLNALLGLGKETGALPWARQKLSDLWNPPTDMTGFQTAYTPPEYTPSFEVPQMGELGTGTFGLEDISTPSLFNFY